MSLSEAQQVPIDMMPTCPVCEGQDMQSVLHERLMASQKSLLYILKDASNDFAKYKYPKADSYIAKCREALLENDLLLKRTFSFDRDDMTVSIVFELIAPDVGQVDTDQVCFPVVVRTGMPEDKATSAAVTTGTAYYLQGLFMLPRVDSIPEIDDIDDTKFDPAIQSKMAELSELSGLNIERVRTVVTQRASEAKVPVTLEFISTLIETAKTAKGE